jgi:branched-chain amino acid aminotransferase
VSGFHHTWVVTARPFQAVPAAQYERGAAAVLVGVSRNSRGALNPEIKSGNFLNNLLARREARLRGADEGIMLSPDGLLAEGSMSNLFWVRRGVLETPPVSVGILPGVTRGKILEIAMGGPIEGLLSCREVAAGPERLDQAEEILLTSTSLDVLAISSWEGRPVGRGQRGPVARELCQRLRMLYPGAGARRS